MNMCIYYGIYSNVLLSIGRTDTCLPCPLSYISRHGVIHGAYV